MSHNVQIHGYLVEDATVNAVNEKRDVLNFTVASTRVWNNHQGEQQKKTEYFDCVCFRSRGKFSGLINKGRFVKGTEVRVNRAYMETKKNETPEKTYYNTHFVVDGWGDINNQALEVISTKAERDFLRQAIEQGHLKQATTASQQQPAQQQPAQQQPAQQQPAQQQPDPVPQYNEPPMDFDDDIPF